MIDSVKDRIARSGIVADALRFIRRTDRGKPNGVASLDNDGKILVSQLPDAALVETDPTVPAWAKEPLKPEYTSEEVGADKQGTADSVVGSHNVSQESHNDIRLLIQGLSDRLNYLYEGATDKDYDQIIDLVNYIHSNKELIDAITTSKVSVKDIINDLSTAADNKPLSATQGTILKGMIDAIVLDYVKTSQLKAIEDRVKALEDAMGGFKLRGGTSAPLEADEKTLTFVDLIGG